MHAVNTVALATMHVLNVHACLVIDLMYHVMKNDEDVMYVYVYVYDEIVVWWGVRRPLPDHPSDTAHNNHNMQYKCD